MESVESENQGINREIIDNVAKLFGELRMLSGEIMSSVDEIYSYQGQLAIANYEFSKVLVELESANYGTGVNLVLSDAINHLISAILSIHRIILKALEEVAGDRSSVTVIMRIEDICREMNSDEEQHKWFKLIEEVDLSDNSEVKNLKINELQKIFMYMTQRIEMEARPVVTNFKKFQDSMRDGATILEAAMIGFNAKVNVIKVSLAQECPEKLESLDFLVDRIEHNASYVRGFFSILKEPVERLPELYMQIVNSVDGLVRAMMIVLDVLRNYKNDESN